MVTRNERVRQIAKLFSSTEIYHVLIGLQKIGNDSEATVWAEAYVAQQNPPTSLTQGKGGEIMVKCTACGADVTKLDQVPGKRCLRCSDGTGPSTLVQTVRVAK